MIQMIAEIVMCVAEIGVLVIGVAALLTTAGYVL